MRRLWTEPLVTFDGRFHQLDRCCINPRPTGPSPSGSAGSARRPSAGAGPSGDGFTFAGDPDDAVVGLERVREHLAPAGRSEDDFGLELILTRARSVAQVVETAERWREVGGNAVSVLTQKVGLPTIAAHVDYLAEVKAALDSRLN